MKVYEVLAKGNNSCWISYTDRGEDHGGFVLYEGDLIFIEHDFCWVKKESRLNYEPPYSKKDLLVKIYHNKLVSFGENSRDIKYEWTWIENINIVNPLINDKFEISDVIDPNPFTGRPLLKDVTLQWERENKLNKIINI
jgi:hypothetical protein